MFPGLNGPKPLPDGEVHSQFWTNFHRFLAVSAFTISVSLLIRHSERRANAVLFADTQLFLLMMKARGCVKTKNKSTRAKVPVARRSLIELQNLTLDQAESSYASFNDPLHIRLHYRVTECICDPRWSVTFEADIAHERITVPLLPPIMCLQVTTANTAGSFIHHTPSGDITVLRSGELCQLDVHLSKIDLSALEEKYVQQVGLLSLLLLSGSTQVDCVNLVVQVKKDDHGVMKRLIMSPLA